jgi:hypothetical protein
LAGSENANKAKTEGVAKEEGQKINLSIFQLSQVILNLSINSANISYRNSILTRIL